MQHSPQVDGGFCLFGLLTMKCVNYDDCFLISVPFVICMMLNQKKETYENVVYLTLNVTLYKQSNIFSVSWYNLILCRSHMLGRLYP